MRTVLCGLGVGTTMQNSIFAMQAEFRDSMRLVGQATSLASFAQCTLPPSSFPVPYLPLTRLSLQPVLGGTISLAIGQAALSTQLAKNFAKYAPNAPLSVIKESPLAIWDLPKEEIASAVKAYVMSLKIVFVIGVPVSSSLLPCPSLPLSFPFCGHFSSHIFC